MRPALALALALGLLCSPALADDYVTFSSPTGNIQCGIYVTADSADVRCDLQEMAVQSYTEPPADCEFDWGFSFGVASTGKGYLACVSDAVGDGHSMELGYGEEVSLGGITCSSAKTGMTCVNEGGHGFAIAKSRQRLF